MGQSAASNREIFPQPSPLPKPRTRRSVPFAVTFLTGLVGTFVTALLVSQVFYDVFVRRPMPAPNRWSRDLIATQVTTPAVAKGRRLWWLSPFHDESRRGLAVRLLESPGLFREAFPGYDGQREDGALWESLPREPMADAVLWTPTFSSVSRFQSNLLSYSTVAARRLFSRHGADVVFVGNSELFRGLVPAVFAEQLRARQDRKILPKVLLFSQTTGVAMMSEDVLDASRELADGGGRAKIAVWAFSLAHAYPSPFQKPRKESLLDSLSPRRWLPALTWWDLNRFHRDLFRERRAMEGPGVRYESWPNDPVLFVSDAVQGERLAAFAREAPRGKALFDGLCGGEEAAARIERGIAAMKAFADRVVLYLTPTPPERFGLAPQCTPEALKKLLAGRAAKNVTVESSDWLAYGLDYTDFLHPTSRRNVMELSANHANYSGAQKISTRLAAVVAGPTKKL